MLTKVQNPANIDDNSVDYTYMYVYSCLNIIFFSEIYIDKRD